MPSPIGGPAGRQRDGACGEAQGVRALDVRDAKKVLDRGDPEVSLPLRSSPAPPSLPPSLALSFALYQSLHLSDCIEDAALWQHTCNISLM